MNVISCLTPVCPGHVETGERELLMLCANIDNLPMRTAPSAKQMTKNMTDTTNEWPSVPSSSGTTAHGSGQTGKGVEGAKNPWGRTGYRKRNRPATSMAIASWNVRTLLDRKQTNRAERRTALVLKELKRYNVDIAALSETRFLDQGKLTEATSGYTLFWSGRKTGRKSGVGFAIRTPIVSQLESQPQGISDRIMVMRL